MVPTHYWLVQHVQDILYVGTSTRYVTGTSAVRDHLMVPTHYWLIMPLIRRFMVGTSYLVSINGKMSINDVVCGPRTAHGIVVEFHHSNCRGCPALNLELYLGALNTIFTKAKVALPLKIRSVRPVAALQW
jgi:hypothetical protein